MRRINGDGNSKELRAILPARILLIHEPDEHFVDERRGLEGVPTRVAAQGAGGLPLELPVS
jgi:hypothetical protein